MTQFQYIAKLPFPKCKDEHDWHYTCILEITDLNHKINFNNQADLFFEVKYTLSGLEMGSIRSYMNQKNYETPHVFIYTVQHKVPFTIIITSHKNNDLTNLSVKLKPTL
jgi:hypothetical protein